MAKLTPTELKVLAQEAQNRILAAIDAKNNETKNRPEYKNFEINFRKSVVGQTFVQLIDVAMQCDEIMKRDEYSESRHAMPLESIVKQKMDNYCSFLKNTAYPMISELTIGPETTNGNGFKFNLDLHSHFLHELSLKQLTSDADLAKLLEDLVVEFIKKI